MTPWMENKKVLCGLKTLLCVLAGTLLACARSQIRTNTSDAYIYPARPGTNRWTMLSEAEFKNEIVRVPEEIIKKMSTAGLVETVVAYPLLIDALAHSGPGGNGLETLLSRFNAADELCARKDAGMELLARYRTMDPVEAENHPDLTYVFGMQAVETLLARDSVLDNLTDEQCVELLAAAVAKRQIWLDNYGTASGFTGSLPLLIEKISRKTAAGCHSSYLPISKNRSHL